jgi:hypothetical protein
MRMRIMKFRLKAFGLHLLASASVLTLIVGALFLGWYHWPGWYLANAGQVVLVLVCVDVVVGPLLTFVIASPSKPKRELARDIGIIAAVQLCALLYGSGSLWNGRPLYYAFSEDAVSVVQAYDINDHDAELARKQNGEFAPHWYSLPRWVWAPRPQDPKEREEIKSTGDDVISMPRYFKSWELGLPSLRDQLKKADESRFFTQGEKKLLKLRLQAAGLPTDQPNAIPITGRTRPVLAVFDPTTSKITTMLRPN